MSLNIGLYGVGLDTYWPQFKGLEERLRGYLSAIDEYLDQDGVNVLNSGLVDSVEKAWDANKQFKKGQVDVVFVYITTYALSSTVLPVVNDLGVPVIVLNIQPTSKPDYALIESMSDRGDRTGEWLAGCQACSAPEIANVFNRSGISYRLITGYLGEQQVEVEIREWIRALKVQKELKSTNIGLLGHYYDGMLDVYTDITDLAQTFGVNFKMLEMCELDAHHKSVTDAELEKKIAQFHEEFDIVDECEIEEIRRAAHTSVALDKLVETNKLGAMAYYYEGHDGNDYENIVTSIIAGNSLLTAHGVPVAGEYEVKNIIAMKIMDLLDVGGSFSEPYAMDFDADEVLWGHDGPAHFKIAKEKVKLVPLPVYHGKPGKGLSIQMTVQTGLATLFSVVQDKMKGVVLQYAEGESVEGEVFNIGNTNSRYKFSKSVRDFMTDWSYGGPSHHCAIGLTHIGGVLEKLAFILGAETNKVS
ncbi:MAG: L-fucose/L-arabinose isomerase family protein [Bacteroidota bacterium]